MSGDQPNKMSVLKSVWSFFFKGILKMSESVRISNSDQNIGMSDNFPDTITSKYEIVSVIGNGNFGSIYRVTNKENSATFAMKICHVDTTMYPSYARYENRDESAETVEKPLPNEIVVLKRLKNPFIIEMFDYYTTPTVNYLILEFMAGSDLENKMSLDNQLHENCAKFIIFQVAKGLAFLHERKAVHCDLKPCNILLSDTSSWPRAKIADFGCSILDASWASTYCGSNYYMAPEVVQREYEQPFTREADVWSVGVILFEVLTGYIPFPLEKDARSAKREWIFEFTQDNYETQDVNNLIQLMVMVDPDMRATMETVLQHPWFNDKNMISRLERILKTEGSQKKRLLQQETTGSTKAEKNAVRCSN